MLFVELTPALLSKFEDYLHLLKNEREPDKKLHPNTVALNLNIFKTLVKRAIEIENFMKPDKHPFMAFSYKKGIKTMKEKLTSEEIQKIIDVKLPEQSLIWHCRNYFMCRNYCAGIRVGDLML